jgi:hypothetical protein
MICLLNCPNGQWIETSNIVKRKGDKSKINKKYSGKLTNVLPKYIYL